MVQKETWLLHFHQFRQSQVFQEVWVKGRGGEVHLIAGVDNQAINSSMILPKCYKISLI